MSLHRRGVLPLLVLALAGLLLIVTPTAAHAGPVAKVRPFSVLEKVAARQLPQGVLEARWGAVRGARAYQLRVARNARFAGARVVRTRATRARLRNLAVGQRHWLSVRAVRGARTGPWSRVVVRAPRAKRPGRFPAGSGATSTVPDGVAVSWGRVVNATRYRVHAGPFRGAGTPGPWLPSSARTGGAAGTRADLTLAPYGNPLFTQVEAGNAFAPSTKRLSKTWRWSLPGAPRPDADGFPVTVASYNILCGTCPGARVWSDRGDEIADRIRGRGVQVALLQEVQGGITAEMVLDVLGPRWRTAPAAGGSRIVYDGTAVELVASGSFRPVRTGPVPWARLRGLGESDPEFVVSSLHLGHDDVSSTGSHVVDLVQPAATAAARLVAVADGVPIVLGSDLVSTQAWERRHGTGPVHALVDGGFWDGRASDRLVTAGYSTTNKLRAQRAHPAGVASRVDYVLTHGIGTRTLEYGVHPEREPGPPSNHNLVWARVSIPRS